MPTISTEVNGLYVNDSGANKHVAAIIGPSNSDLFPSENVSVPQDYIFIRKFVNTTGGYCVIYNNSDNSVEYEFKYPDQTSWSYGGVLPARETTPAVVPSVAIINLGNHCGVCLKSAASNLHPNYGLCLKGAGTGNVSIFLCSDDNYPDTSVISSIVSGKMTSLLPINLSTLPTNGTFRKMFSFGVIDATFLDLSIPSAMMPSIPYNFYKNLFESSDLVFSPYIIMDDPPYGMFMEMFTGSENLKIVRGYLTHMTQLATEGWLAQTNNNGIFVKIKDEVWSFDNENGTMESEGWIQKDSTDLDIYSNI